jgi:hypothetical protein
MKKINLFISGIILSSVAWPWAAIAGDVFPTPFLPRAVAMGGAYAAMAGDVYSMAYNPAGLGQVRNAQVCLLHNIGIIDSREYVAAAGPIKVGGTLGAGLLYRGLPPIENEGAVDPAVKSSDMAVNVSYALAFSTGQAVEEKNLSAGVNIKWLRSVLGEYTATCMAADLGVWWQPVGLKAIQLGLVLQNLGTTLKYIEVEESLPLNLKLGTVCHILQDVNHEVTLAADINLPLAADWFYAGLGAEYCFNRLIVLRAGYQYQDESLASVIMGGVGLRYLLGSFEVQLDYAFKPVVFSEETLEAEHFLSLTIGF